MTEVYSSVPEQVMQEVEFEEKQKIRFFLENHKGEFFLARKLAIECGFRITGTQVELRKAITELIEFEGCPIVANAKGFAWVSCANQVKFYVESLLNRQQGLQRRIEKLNGIYYELLEKEQKVLNGL